MNNRYTFFDDKIEYKRPLDREKKGSKAIRRTGSEISLFGRDKKKKQGWKSSVVVGSMR